MLTEKQINSLLKDEVKEETIVNTETTEDKIINAFNDKLEEMTKAFNDTIDSKINIPLENDVNINESEENKNE